MPVDYNSSEVDSSEPIKRQVSAGYLYCMKPEHPLCSLFFLSLLLCLQCSASTYDSRQKCINFLQQEAKWNQTVVNDDSCFFLGLKKVEDRKQVATKISSVKETSFFCSLFSLHLSFMQLFSVMGDRIWRGIFSW